MTNEEFQRRVTQQVGAHVAEGVRRVEQDYAAEERKRAMAYLVHDELVAALRKIAGETFDANARRIAEAALRKVGA